jgi:hypothetical protein
LRAGIFKYHAVLLEDAGILPERRRLVFPVVDLPNDDLERVLGASKTSAQSKRHRNAERTNNILESIHAISSLIVLRYRPG